MRQLFLCALLSACGPTPTPDPVPLELPDAGLVDECHVVPPELATCAGCHDEASSIEGWYSLPDDARLATDTWGRGAYFVLFTQSNSLTVPEHRAPYDWAGRCFCTRVPGERRCYTLEGEF